MDFVLIRRCTVMSFAGLVLGSWTVSAAPQPARTSAPTSIEVAFSPGRAQTLVVDTIRGASASIQVAAYVFTSKPVATALRDAARRGVKVAVLVDAETASKGYKAARFLANQGIPVRTNARYAIQHNKFMVIDGATVQTGSFNYTASAADRNAENVLVIRDAPTVTSAYATEWRRLWDEGTDVGPTY